jgi:hypothetical protein
VTRGLSSILGCGLSGVTLEVVETAGIRKPGISSNVEAEELEQLAPRGGAAGARYDEGMLRLLDG